MSAAREAAEGDVAAFENLMRRYRSRVLANCRYLSRSASDAEDLAQEVFVKAYFGLKTFEGRSSFKTWIRRIKMNHCLNYLEQRRGKTWISLDDDESSLREPAVRSNADRDLDSAEANERIGEVLDSMSDTLRLPLILRDADGLAYEEIAERLEVGLSAVKMRIKRGREEFRRRFDGAAGGGR